jgi:hypothetical protein
MSAEIIELPMPREPAGKATSSDPILKAIERHRTALAARWASCAVYGDVRPCDPNSQKAESHISAALARESRELEVLLACRPRTVAGLLALLDHVGQLEDPPAPPGVDNRTIITGAFEGEQISTDDWSRYLGKIARGLIDAESAAS